MSTEQRYFIEVKKIFEVMERKSEMAKITIKNILDNYIPSSYLLKGVSGRPMSWETNITLVCIDIPVTIIWIIFAFFSHGLSKEFFTSYAWIWGLNALASLLIVGIVSISRHKELFNKWTSPATFLLMINCVLNINLSFSFLDDRCNEIGIRTIINMTVGLLLMLLIHIIVHFIIAIISIYKGKDIGEKISGGYIVLVCAIGCLLYSFYENYSGILATEMLMSVFALIISFSIHSVYLTFHPEKYVPDEEEDDEAKETLSKSKKYLK